MSINVRRSTVKHQEAPGHQGSESRPLCHDDDVTYQSIPVVKAQKPSVALHAAPSSCRTALRACFGVSIVVALARSAVCSRRWSPSVACVRRDSFRPLPPLLPRTAFASCERGAPPPPPLVSGAAGTTAMWGVSATPSPMPSSASGPGRTRSHPLRRRHHRRAFALGDEVGAVPRQHPGGVAVGRPCPPGHLPAPRAALCGLLWW